MTNIQIFTNPEFGEIRTTTYNGEIAFVAKDVAERLGYTWQVNVINHIPGEWKGVNRINVRSGNGVEQERELWVLTEQGLYFFLARSDKLLALPFQKWIAREVLPSIRKHGAYLTPDTIEKVLSDPDTIIKIATQLKEERQLRLTAEAKIASDKPLVDFATTFKNSNIVCHVQGLANILFNNGVDTGRNRLINDLRDSGDIMKHEPLLTQKARDRGIGQNVPTGSYTYRGVAHVSYRAFLNYKGIVEVFDRYNLTQDQREAVLRDLTKDDEPLSPEVGGALIVNDPYGNGEVEVA